ncbi:hypothetical protein DSOUD_1853 [Desulfuromonas soudanensis]|uniref:YtkA-like domain-containing protein n=1 Tax=Desulfuromonas soudanensis TaxID=1603606 RepID=A0A0M4DHQ4_9BACT|nr:hypothetical protein [Desulfuromonas soudanensis]ALC16625.1 hypothetical protein DSOUD_1853 [Desulfuromonas soudanensis]
MKKVNALLAALFLLSLPLAAGAMEGMKHDKMEKMEHGSMEGMKHEGMKMEGMIMLGEGTEEGVKAMAHLNDVKEAMAKMGMKETHHFMVAFVDAAGKPVTEGTVAVKIKNPAGKEGKAIKLMGMEGHFGADIVLPEKGEYHFKVGTKLADGQKREYHFHHTVE